jgi:hypothetical protein
MELATAAAARPAAFGPVVDCGPALNGDGENEDGGPGGPGAQCGSPADAGVGQ